MAQTSTSKRNAPSTSTRKEQPIILIRGFGGLGVEDEKRIAYQGFNDGTVYPQKRGENYIYEGLVLRLMKSRWTYRDATNVVGYYGEEVLTQLSNLPEALKDLDPVLFSGNRVVIDPAMALALVNAGPASSKSLWIFRYYDLNDRMFAVYGEALLRVITLIRALLKDENDGMPKVNIIAHSMGGLIVREAIQRAYPKAGGRDPKREINKIVTLGTPHRGISFQILRNWMGVDAQQELEHFNPDFQEDANNPVSYKNFGKHFPERRLLTVVGTNYRTYSVAPASWLNRIFSASSEFGLNYNRSDGLVKQISAQVPGAPRTFVHKCHGGFDSLVTSREAFEVATRFFFGNVHARLHLVAANIERGFDLIGKSEFFFGVSIKPRGVDFDLFHQSSEAENCYGPFEQPDFTDPKPAFDWAGPDRLIWEGWLDLGSRAVGGEVEGPTDLVVRLDVYVGERDLLGLGFSDNVVFRKQYYVRALLEDSLKLQLHKGEEFRQGAEGDPMEQVADGWEFKVGGTGFKATMRISLDSVPDEGSI